MKPESDRNYLRVHKAVLLVIILLAMAGVVGWWFGSKNSADERRAQSTNSDNSAQPIDSSNDPTTNVKSLITYTLPDGWKESSCPSSAGSAFVAPQGSGSVNCNATPSSPVKISLDPAKTKDCNQLQNVQNVSKHVCISEYINGHKSLKSETVYNKASSYKKDTAISAYYIDTEKGVVKVEYIHDPSNNEHQAGFEQLAKSAQAKD